MGSLISCPEEETPAEQEPCEIYIQFEEVPYCEEEAEECANNNQEPQEESLAEDQNCLVVQDANNVKDANCTCTTDIPKANEECQVQPQPVNDIACNSEFRNTLSYVNPCNSTLKKPTSDINRSKESKLSPISTSSATTESRTCEIKLPLPPQCAKINATCSEKPTQEEPSSQIPVTSPKKSTESCADEKKPEPVSSDKVPEKVSPMSDPCVTQSVVEDEVKPPKVKDPCEEKPPTNIAPKPSPKVVPEVTPTRIESTDCEEPKRGKISVDSKVQVPEEQKPIESKKVEDRDSEKKVESKSSERAQSEDTTKCDGEIRCVSCRQSSCTCNKDLKDYLRKIAGLGDYPQVTPLLQKTQIPGTPEPNYKAVKHTQGPQPEDIQRQKLENMLCGCPKCVGERGLNAGGLSVPIRWSPPPSPPCSHCGAKVRGTNWNCAMCAFTRRARDTYQYQYDNSCSKQSSGESPVFAIPTCDDDDDDDDCIVIKDGQPVYRGGMSLDACTRFLNLVNRGETIFTKLAMIDEWNGFGSKCNQQSGDNASGAKVQASDTCQGTLGGVKYKGGQTLDEVTDFLWSCKN